MNDFCCYGNGPIVVLSRHRLGEAWIPCLYGKSCQSGCFSNGWRNLFPVPLKHRDQLCQIMHEGKYDAAKQQESFDRFFRSLLRVKTEILKVDIGKIDVSCGSGEIAFSSVQPFDRIVRWTALRRHTQPCPREPPDR